MKYCSQCGKEISEDTAICPNCGYQSHKKQNPSTEISSHKSAKFSVTAITGFILTLIGAIATISFLIYVGIKFPLGYYKIELMHDFFPFLVAFLMVAMVCSCAAAFVVKLKNKRGIVFAFSGMFGAAAILSFILFYIICL